MRKQKFDTICCLCAERPLFKSGEAYQQHLKEHHPDYYQPHTIDHQKFPHTSSVLEWLVLHPSALMEILEAVECGAINTPSETLMRMDTSAALEELCIAAGDRKLLFHTLWRRTGEEPKTKHLPLLRRMVRDFAGYDDFPDFVNGLFTGAKPGEKCLLCGALLPKWEDFDEEMRHLQVCPKLKLAAETAVSA
jgi:hypothetical protein